MRLASLGALAAVLLIVPGVGCEATPGTLPRETMPTATEKLVGNWEKITDSTCSQTYPDTIQFQERGFYFGQNEPPGTFTQWDVGTFEVVGPDQIEISTANDAIVTYKFSMAEDVLAFTDPDGCEYKYRRVPPGASLRHAGDEAS